VACYDGGSNGPARSDTQETYWRTFAAPLTPYFRGATGSTGYYGEHYQSCNHSRSAGTASIPFMETFYRTTNLGSTISQRKYDNEIVMIWGGDNSVAEKIARFAKTCAAVAGSFAANRPRAVVAQDGRFAAFATDGSNCSLSGQPWVMMIVRLD